MPAKQPTAHSAGPKKDAAVKKLEGEELAAHPTVKKLAKAAGATIVLAKPSGSYARLVKDGQSLGMVYHRPARGYFVLETGRFSATKMPDPPVTETSSRILVTDDTLDACCAFVKWAAETAKAAAAESKVS